MHIHSKFSDGEGGLDDIIAAGQQAALDYIAITDHNTLHARDYGYEGWHQEILVAVGEEASAGFEHCLAFGANTRIGRWHSADRMIKAIDAEGGVSIIAHPHGRYWRWVDHRAYPWKSWDAPFTGIELWSYMWDWIKDVRYYNPVNFLPRYANPDRFIHGPHPETIRQWDELTRHRKVVAIGGLDVHARKLVGGLFVVFPYHQLFRTLLTYILTPEPFRRTGDADLASLYYALESGHCYLSYEPLHCGHGFMFQGGNAAGETGLMGDDLRYVPPVVFEVHLPRSGEGYLIRNGVLYDQFTDQRYTRPVNDPGVYRIEVRIDGRPWIYSNPIYLRSSDGI